jgi:hypothetical protein
MGILINQFLFRQNFQIKFEQKPTDIYEFHGFHRNRTHINIVTLDSESCKSILYTPCILMCLTFETWQLTLDTSNMSPVLGIKQCDCLCYLVTATPSPSSSCYIFTFVPLYFLFLLLVAKTSSNLFVVSINVILKKWRLYLFTRIFILYGLSQKLYLFSKD